MTPGAAKPVRGAHPSLAVRKLLLPEAPSVCAFLMALAPEDRYRRFGRSMTDTDILTYAGQIDWSETVMLGAFNGNADLIGLLELCDGGRCVEIGLAVASPYREQGVAKALVYRALGEASLAGKERVVLSCLSENIPMRRLAHSIGLVASPSTHLNHEVELDTQDRIGNAAHQPPHNIIYSAAL